MKIIFMGDKSVGHGILEYLIANETVKMAFVQQPPETIWYPSVIELCKKSGVPWTAQSINEYEGDLECDYMVCAYYDTIISSRVLSIAPAINVHMGLIQEYRGCYPTTFPILEDKKKAGVTIHEMTPDIDGGRVFAQATVSVDQGDSGKSLYYKCVGAAMDLFEKTWPSIKDGVEPGEVKRTNRYIKRTDFPPLEIKLSWPEEKIDRHVRALTFPPFQRPYFVINNHKFEVHYGNS